jgi:hypothetical protein
MDRLRPSTIRKLGLDGGHRTLTVVTGRAPLSSVTVVETSQRPTPRAISTGS